MPSSAASIFMTVHRHVSVGTPIGMLAGTYMAEYGTATRRSPSMVIRFINDILLSAPSIVIGLFVYEVVVTRMGHFSGIAGAPGSRDPRHPGRRAHHRGHAAPRARRRFARHRRGLGMPRSHMIVQRRLSRRARRPYHRRAARGRARQRRDRAAALHGAQQFQFVSTEPGRADGEPAGRHLPVRAELRYSRTGSSSPGRAHCSSRSLCSRCRSPRHDRKDQTMTRRTESHGAPRIAAAERATHACGSIKVGRTISARRPERSKPSHDDARTSSSSTGDKLAL